MRVGAAVIGLVVIVLLVVTGLGLLGGGSSVTGGTRPFAVHTTLTPTATFFGDPVVADVAVEVDKRDVSPGSVSVAPGFAPYAQSGPPAVQRNTAGDEETIHYRYTLQCVGDGCLPVGPRAKVVQFPAVLVTATSAGKTLKMSAPWPSLPVSTRLSSADLASSSPKFRTASVPPPARFGVSPVVANLLTAAGALLGLAALALVGLELAALLARRRRLALARLSPLELALAYAREAAGRPDPADRRKALGLLARALEGSDSELADTAGDVAWSEPAPTPERTLELADEAQPLYPVESA
jgi:hypothetical protein